MQYAEPVDEWNPRNAELYSLVASYFDNITLRKRFDKQGCSAYYGRVYSLLGGPQGRYIIAIVSPADLNPPGTDKSLNELEWVNLQTRTLPTNEQPHLPVQSYQPKRGPPYTTTLIERKYQDADRSYYVCPKFASLSVTLLNGRQPYQQQGALAAALETFQTILHISK